MAHVGSSLSALTVLDSLGSLSLRPHTIDVYGITKPASCAQP